jgi:hypothetical protein
MTETRELRLPAELCDGVEKKFSTKFKSLDELLIFVLQELSHDDATRADEAEQHVIEQRLRELGYI